jgi:amidase
MNRDELAFAGVMRQAELLRGGEVSSRELVELYLDRIERLDPELNALRTVMAERALADADQADARRRAGEERPVLGVPIAVKDTEDVAGEVTGWGTGAHGGPAERDKELVSRLRAAGAVILGKTNLPELAIIGATEGPAFGVTRTHGTPTAPPAARAAGAVRRWPPASAPPPPRRTGAARSGFRPRAVGSSASSRSEIASRWRRLPSTGTASAWPAS